MWAYLAQPIILFMFNDHSSGPRVDEAPITIRHAGAADMASLQRLAQLDSRHIPSGELFVAEVAGRLVAAVSSDTGAVIADPFEHTASIVKLLRLHGAAVSTRDPGPAAVATVEPALAQAA
jgi:hypothetical protein